MDPVVSATRTTFPLLQGQLISEEELNSEVELLQDRGLLRDAVVKSGLAEQTSGLSWLRREDPEEKIERAVQRLEKDLVIRPVRKSQVFTASYTSRNPMLAAKVLQTLADVYLARQAQLRRPTGQLVFLTNS
jgi:uncharacterized protein involved in exopolysaccharide biosynthesis